MASRVRINPESGGTGMRVDNRKRKDRLGEYLNLAASGAVKPTTKSWLVR